MRQLFIILLFLCSLGTYAQREKVERKTSTSTSAATQNKSTSAKAETKKQNTTTKAEPKKQTTTTSTPKQNTTAKAEPKKQTTTSSTSKQNTTAKAESKKQATSSSTPRQNSTVKSEPKKQAPAIGSYNGHDYVDLGLPSGTKWATMNIGASSKPVQLNKNEIEEIEIYKDGYMTNSGYAFHIHIKKGSSN